MCYSKEISSPCVVRIKRSKIEQDKRELLKKYVPIAVDVIESLNVELVKVQTETKRLEKEGIGCNPVNAYSLQCLWSIERILKKAIKTIESKLQ